MSETNNSICFLGAGNMGEALIKGCLSNSPNIKLSFLEVDTPRADYISDTYKIQKLSNYSAINNSSILIIAVKPQTIPKIIQELSNFLSENILIVSIVAGISIAYYQKYFFTQKIIRVMPNTPCLINKGVSVISTCNKCKQNDINQISKIFSYTGKVFLMDEAKINAVTALSGSGPAYFYHLADTFAKQSLELGLKYHEALSLITNTMLGSAEMILLEKYSVEELIKQVKSPGGTTEAGLKELQTTELDQIINKSLIAAYSRANELNIKE
jgi:pyrroline-5-carboxylate reductase